MSTPGLPDYKKPPKAEQAKARAERDRRKACHGDWTPCKHSFDNADLSKPKEA